MSRYTVAEFRELPIEKQHEVLKERKVQVITDDLVDTYRKSLYEELVTVANSVSPVGDAEDVEVEWDPGAATDNARIGVQLAAGAETMYFSSYAEAFAALEAAKPKPIDYPALELRALEEAGVQVEVKGDQTVAFVVMDAEGKPQVFHDVDAALKAVAEARKDKPVLVSDLSMDSRLLAASMLGRHKPEVLLVDAVVEKEHVHGPDCGHDHLPQVQGLDELMRVNPEMPSTPFRDGELLTLPQPGQEPDYLLKGENAEITPKQKTLLDNFVRDYNAWTQNAQDNRLRREIKDHIYRLNTAGVILNPKFAKTLAEGAKQLRDQKKLTKFGGSVKELTEKAAAEGKVP